MKRKKTIYFLIVSLVLFLPMISSLVVQATTPRTTYAIETLTKENGHETYSHTLTTTWAGGRYHTVKLYVDYQYWTYWEEDNLYTYQQWKFRVEFDMHDKIKKLQDNDVVEYLVGGDSIYFEHYRKFMDGDSVTRSSPYCFGHSSAGINNLEIKLYVCSRVRAWFVHQTWHYKIYSLGPPGSFTWNMRRTD